MTMSEIMSELGNNAIVGYILFFIGILIFYLFMRFFVRIYFKYGNRE